MTHSEGKKPSLPLLSSPPPHIVLISTKNMCAAISSDYEYINENDQIDDELKCVICKQILESPVSLLVCQHTFCESCINTWLRENETCPICRQPTICVYSGGYHPSLRTPAYVPINTRIVLNQLARLHVRCLRCDQTNIQRCQWENHQKTCLNRIVACPSADIQCPWQGARDVLAIHMNDCPFQQVRPIIDKFKAELNSARTAQTELQKTVDTLNRKVDFLLTFINNGNIMNKNCTTTTTTAKECQYQDESNRSFRFTCSICREYIRREDVAVHACDGDCICRVCVRSQYSDH